MKNFLETFRNTAYIFESERTLAEVSDILLNAGNPHHLESWNHIRSYLRNFIAKKLSGIIAKSAVKDIEDIVQEACIKISSSINTFRGDSSFQTWISSVARNTALNWNTEMGRKPYMQHHVDDDVFNYLKNDFTDSDDPYTVLEGQERSAYMLEQWEKSVSPELAGTFRATSLDPNFSSTVEVSNAQSLNLGTVRTRRHRVKKLLGKWYKNYDDSN